MTTLEWLLLYTTASSLTISYLFVLSPPTTIFSLHPLMKLLVVVMLTLGWPLLVAQAIDEIRADRRKR